MRKYSILIILSFALSACTLGSGTYQIPRKVQKAPDLLYKFGMKRLKSKDFEEARIIFKKVRSKFPISMYATLAELRLADTHRREEHFATAAAAYRDFFKDHPNHTMVLSGYVMYMIGYCNFRLGPGDFFIFPPAYERDLTYTYNAYMIFNVFFRRYPKSIYKKNVTKYYKRALTRLAAHELYVANFYLKKKKIKGAKLRLEHLVRKFPDAEIAPSAAITLANLYIDSGEFAKASTILKTVLRKYAGRKEAKEALASLAKLKGKRK